MKTPKAFTFGSEEFPLMHHAESNAAKVMGCGVLG